MLLCWPLSMRPRHYDRFVLIGLCWLYGRSEFPPPPPADCNVFKLMVLVTQRILLWPQQLQLDALSHSTPAQSQSAVTIIRRLQYCTCQNNPSGQNTHMSDINHKKQLKDPWVVATTQACVLRSLLAQPLELKKKMTLGSILSSIHSID